MAYTNRAFLCRAINEAQRLDVNDLKCQALTDYIRRETELAWDDERALFWVKHPDAGWQVAVWMMPVASQFEPMGA